ncbi:MAG: hypothetical protein KC656_18325 [Myxococcales bacterium]|nr:hypothetical protein [Myxococcales bacterium]
MDITPLADLPRYTGERETIELGAAQELGKDAFLKLLTVQLRNQDPTDPVKNEQFVAQLAQFSSLEQLVGLQETMDGVYLGIATMNNSSMSQLIGKEVVAVGDGFHLGASGDVEIPFEASGPYQGGQISVIDESGTVIFSGKLGPGMEGEGSFVWDGRQTSGERAPEGVYRFVVTAEGDDAPQMRGLVKGMIDEMDFSTGTPLPSVDGVQITLDAVLRLGA